MTHPRWAVKCNNMDRILINIGRQVGSGGHSVAVALGQKLGIDVYDNELLIKFAEKSGLSADYIKQKDERPELGMGFGGRLGSPTYSGFTRGMLGEGELFRVQSETIMEIAMHGSAIFVGRASDYVLRDLKTLDVFVTAPLEVRKAAVAQRQGITPEQAGNLIRRQDRRRKDYYDLITMGDNWGVASNYDLCVDSSILGIDKTADYIITFGRAAGLI